MIELTEIAKATILLCSNLGLKNTEYTPFTSIQWYNLCVRILKSSYETPDKLIGAEVPELVAKLDIPEQEAQRIHGLLSRGYSLAFALEELAQKGIGVVTKSNAEYPQRLKQILGSRNAPPVLYYCGDLSLANLPGVAIVGSRNIDGVGMDCARQVAQAAVAHNLAVYSGGARGVDSISREGALEANGAVVEFVADSMQKKIRLKEYRQAIMAKKLLLLSAVRPDAGFSVPNAMNRNKFVYALSQRAFVISSEKNKGGTWAGAKESLTKGYVPVSVWKHDAYSGNGELVKLGAVAFNDVMDIDFNNLAAAPKFQEPQANYEEPNLFSSIVDEAEDVPAENKSTVPKADKAEQNATVAEQTEVKPDAIGKTIYDQVLPILMSYFKEEKNLDVACLELDVEKSQLSKWLDKAEAEGLVEKKMRPKRYITLK